LRKFLEERYPNQLGSIEAEQYPPPLIGVVASQLAGFAQLAVVVLLLGGEKVFSFLGFAQPPAWYATVAENKMMTFGAVWFANNFANQLISTGAFEILVDDELVFSKLETGRLPTMRDIVHGFKRFGLEMHKSSPQLD